jgi:hypothetical protein
VGVFSRACCKMRVVSELFPHGPLMSGGKGKKSSGKYISLLRFIIFNSALVISIQIINIIYIPNTNKQLYLRRQKQLRETRS